MRRLITSESVTEGHPDKVCDRISDGVLDELLEKDPNSRVACETCVTTGFVLVMGEITTNAYADVESVARKCIKDIGYTDSALGFDYQSCSVMTMIHAQSADIALGVDRSMEQKSGGGDRYDLIGAGDQGIMYGYACRETDSLMPMPIHLAHGLVKRLALVRKTGVLPFLRPDGKSQVTIEYENGIPKRIDTVVISAQHNPEITLSQLKESIMEEVVKQSVPSKLLDKNTKYYINPTGQFVVGGPAGDSGLTGRKIIVDTYGGYCPHGGGAFSGKDPTKVDRSASYMARYACKNIVAAGLADRLEMQIGYAIGVARPVSLYVDSFGTGRLPDDKITEIAQKVFDFRPRAIIESMNLLQPIYSGLSAYGHFGRDGVAWENTDKAEELKQYL